jgi:predicted GIY-YIG superfamily endonuclease
MFGPVELVYLEEVQDHSAALKREAEIKQLKHNRKAALAVSQNVSEELVSLVIQEGAADD